MQGLLKSQHPLLQFPVHAANIVRAQNGHGLSLVQAELAREELSDSLGVQRWFGQAHDDVGQRGRGGTISTSSSERKHWLLGDTIVYY